MFSVGIQTQDSRLRSEDLSETYHNCIYSVLKSATTSCRKVPGVSEKRISNCGLQWLDSYPRIHDLAALAWR